MLSNHLPALPPTPSSTPPEWALLPALPLTPLPVLLRTYPPSASTSSLSVGASQSSPTLLPLTPLSILPLTPLPTSPTSPLPTTLAVADTTLPVQPTLLVKPVPQFTLLPTRLPASPPAWATRMLAESTQRLAESTRRLARIQAEHNIAMAAIWAQNIKKAQVNVERWTAWEQIYASSQSRGWATKLAETTKARIAEERYLAKARKAEEEFRAKIERAEEEERCQRIAQAMAAKKAKVNIRTPTPKLQCTLKDFWLVKRILSSTTMRSSPPRLAKPLPVLKQSTLDSWLAPTLSSKPSTLGTKIGTISSLIVATCSSGYSNVLTRQWFGSTGNIQLALGLF